MPSSANMLPTHTGKGSASGSVANSCSMSFVRAVVGATVAVHGGGVASAYDGRPEGGGMALYEGMYDEGRGDERRSTSGIPMLGAAAGGGSPSPVCRMTRRGAAGEGMAADGAAAASGAAAGGTAAGVAGDAAAGAAATGGTAAGVAAAMGVSSPTGGEGGAGSMAAYLASTAQR